jgi:L-aspartate oxidase
MQTCEFLVIGSGSAGLTFALATSAYGRVTLVTKKERTDSNTNWAQGGIAGVLGPDDDTGLHLDDTIIAGAGLCNDEAVRVLVTEGPDRIRDLMRLGARFNRDESGELSLGMEGGHSRRRIVRASDLTGQEVERSLVDEAREHPNIDVLEHHMAVDLIVENGICRGAYVLDEANGDVEAYMAQSTLLATGGCGQVYQHTTNPPIATGDGVAMGWRAGCEIANMEFIQFHPTSLCIAGAKSYLISEAVRGEGGILRRPDGLAFMAEYDERRELAPRDIVARAIDSEIKKGNTQCVYLDVTHLDPDHIKAHFPNIYAKCLTFGIDMTVDQIPVVPAAHYSCGGVRTDLHGRTTVERLYACGEVACTGVHGANRLASNSLLEALVYAHRAAVDAIATTGSNARHDDTRQFAWDLVSPGDTATSEDDIRNRLQAVMQRFVGIVRGNSRLNKAMAAVKELRNEASGMFSDGRVTGERLEVRNMLDVAELIVRSAQLRKESRGLHFTTDYPMQRDDQRHDTVLKM